MQKFDYMHKHFAKLHRASASSANEAIKHRHFSEDVCLRTMYLPIVILLSQAEEASDQVILATEQAEDLSLDALEQELESKHDVLNQACATLQELQASLLPWKALVIKLSQL